VQSYSQALSLNPQDWCVHNNLGVLLKEQGLWDKAEQEYRLALSLAPADSTRMVKDNLATLLTDNGSNRKLQGQPDKAIELYQQAINFNERYAPAFFNLGVVYSEAGKLSEATQCYSTAVSINPQYVEALSNLGVLYKGQVIAVDGG
jgi:protein O-GlcNAc transferase